MTIWLKGGKWEKKITLLLTTAAIKVLKHSDEASTTGK
jgi:hypothetical protein